MLFVRSIAPFYSSYPTPPTTGRDRDRHPRAVYSALSTLATGSGLSCLLQVLLRNSSMTDEGIKSHGRLALYVANIATVKKVTFL